MIYTTAATCGILIVLTTKRGMAFSKEGFLSGITSNIGAMTMAVYVSLKSGLSSFFVCIIRICYLLSDNLGFRKTQVVQ